jgi:predicted ATP-grasp superfamily ATP-dependent carboligase
MNVLVLSATAAAINVLLSLKDIPDLRLFVTDADPYAAGLYYNFVTPIVIPRARDSEKYRKALEHILTEYNIEMLLPSSDHDMEGIMELISHGWEPNVKMFRPDYKIYRTLSDKLALNSALSKNGFLVPKCFSSNESLQFPVVVKPTREGGGKGVYLVDNAQECALKLAEIRARFGDSYIIQEYIPGGAGSIYMVVLIYGQDGKMYGESVTQSHRTFYTWGASGIAGTIVHEPEAAALAQSMIASLGGWVGPINLEFKRHAENRRFYLMEANCRLNGYSYLNTMNGLNFPKAMYELLVEGCTSPLSYKQLSQPINFVYGLREKPIAP